jgi:hypothetical protein
MFDTTDVVSFGISGTITGGSVDFFEHPMKEIQSMVTAALSKNSLKDNIIGIFI